MGFPGQEYWPGKKKKKNTEVGCYFLLHRGSSQPRNQNWISCIAGGFFANRAMRDPTFAFKYSAIKWRLRYSLSKIAFKRIIYYNSIWVQLKHPSVFSLFKIFNWRIIALQCCVIYCHTFTWISHRYTWVSYVCKWVKSLSRVRLFATPWTVAHQAPPSMGFSRQEYWSGLPIPSPGDLPNPGIEPRSPTLWADALTSEPPGKPCL